MEKKKGMLTWHASTYHQEKARTVRLFKEETFFPTLIFLTQYVLCTVTSYRPSIIKCVCVIQKLKGGCLIFHLPQWLDKPGFTVIPLLQPQNYKLWNNPRVIQFICQKNIIMVLLWKWCYLDLADILMVWINGAPPYNKPFKRAHCITFYSTCAWDLYPNEDQVFREKMQSHRFPFSPQTCRVSSGRHLSSQACWSYLERRSEGKITVNPEEFMLLKMLHCIN